MTRNFEVKPAKTEGSYVRMALVGAAGSGKTFSALRLATGFGGKIVLIDTENRRSAKYSKRFAFDQIDFQPPFNPASYGDAIDAALAAGAKTIIIDSMSHEHEGEGGILEMAESFLDKRAGDDFKKRENLKFASWIAPKRERTQLIVNKIQRVPANIILCFRAKEVTKPVRNAQGKIEPIKEWDMIGGDEYRYEMDVTMFLPSGSDGVPDWNHSMRRVNDADGNLRAFLMSAGQLTEDVGRRIKGMNEPSEADQTKAAAARLAGAIRSASSKEELETIMEGNRQIISEIKGKSTAAYDFITQLYEEKKAILPSIMPEAQGYATTDPDSASKCMECDGKMYIEMSDGEQEWKESCPLCGGGGD
jgi:hypothetical protein